jgi:TetR/AcrR family transcriptional regulator, fatty acid metabolism regulator protein
MFATASGDRVIMTAKPIEQRPRATYADRPFPPGKIKIMAALESLLEEKDFVSITTAEIAKTAGVTEGLIYKYFQDKRDLLHEVLAEFLEFFITRAEKDVRDIQGAVNKLRQVIWTHISMYAHNRVFAKILILEVRNYPDYFNSDAYEMVRRYTDFLLDVVEEGQSEGSIRNDIPSSAIRQIILGGIEHVCLPGVLFNLPLDPDKVSEQLAEVILGGIASAYR